MPKLTRNMWLGLSGGLAAAVIALLLWIGGVLSGAPEVTAYATAVLAIGTSGLAAGAIGTYVEQCNTNQQQIKEIEQQAQELERTEPMTSRKSVWRDMRGQEIPEQFLFVTAHRAS